VSTAAHADPDPTAVTRAGAGFQPPRDAEAATLMAMMARVTGAEPRLWGGRLIGYGRYDYVYASGRSGSWFETGFGAAKARLSIHVLPDLAGLADDLARLGPHKAAVSCIYVTRLARVDPDVLERILARGVARLRGLYPARTEG
jgi:hypothetical protein